jgi:hypothetical protein
VCHLSPNASFPGDSAYLDKVRVTCGGVKNPFVEFSLGKQQAVVITKTRDLEYARTKLSNRSRLLALTEDRYFLSLAAKDPELRGYLLSKLDPAAVFQTAAKAEGSLLAMVESNDSTGAANTMRAWEKGIPTIGEPLEILYRTDDPVSVRVAEKLLASLDPGGIPCKLRPSDGTGYERGLVARDYAIAVGWVSSHALRDETRRLRLASMWFADETDEHRRIEDARELPLFSVNRYLLCKPNLGFGNGKLAGMYLRK